MEAKPSGDSHLHSTKAPAGKLIYNKLYANYSDYIMNTTIQLDKALVKMLQGIKEYPRQTYGEPELAPYFATAIAEEVGEQHLDTLKQIISEKYGISAEEQE